LVAASRRHRGLPPVGAQLRAERQTRGLSLRELADRLGVSPSLISQIETGRTRPSVSSLYAIANELGVSLDELLFVDTNHSDAPAETGQSDLTAKALPGGELPRSIGPVQRAHDRKRIRLASGVQWERLTTTSDFGTEFLMVTYEVGGASSPEHQFQRHGGREWGYVLSGTLGVTIAFEDFELNPNDSISLDSTIPHRLYNRGTIPVRAIWFVAGRTSLERSGSTSWDHGSREIDGSKPNPA
jgi:transcriptional regulator with XRE-family HTH domain